MKTMPELKSLFAVGNRFLFNGQEREVIRIDEGAVVRHRVRESDGFLAAAGWETLNYWICDGKITFDPIDTLIHSVLG